MSVQISHKLDLDPELPEKYKEVALKQGEDPNTFKMHLDELRKMIFGEFEFYNSLYKMLFNHFYLFQRGAILNPIVLMTSIFFGSFEHVSSNLKMHTNW